MLHLSLPETPGRFNPLSSITKQGRAAIVAALEAHNMRAKITPALIASLRPPTDRPEAFVWDEEVRGWGIRLLRSGTASWVTQVKVKGKPVSKRQTFARVSKLPYTLAKERARHIVALAELGRDWYAERAAEEAAERAADQAAKIDHSLGAKIEAYLADPVVKQQRTYWATERYLLKTWAPLHRISAETVTSKEITRQLEQIAVDSGTVTANRARSRLATAFRWMLDTHRLERDDNPVSRARRWKERGRRNRAPSLGEVAAIWRAAGEVHPTTFGAIVRLLILTAARKSEIALLSRQEIDLEAAEILLPPARVKIDMPYWLPLAPAAGRLLRALPERRSARLFPTISWARCKKDLNKASGVSDWTLHDLRRSFSSIARDQLHVDSDDVERALGHIPAGVRGKYDFSERRQQRRALAEAWANLVLKAAGEPVDQPALRVVEGIGR